MSKTFSMTAKGLLLVLLTLAFGLMQTAPAQARANPYTPKELCGQDYYIQRKHVLKGGVAVVYQLYNGTYNCAVTIKTADVGTPTYVGTGLWVKGYKDQYDYEKYKYYAGPVKLKAKGKCVKLYGIYGVDSDDNHYESKFGFCG